MAFETFHYYHQHKEQPLTFLRTIHTTTVQNLSAMAQMWNLVCYVWTHFTLTKKFRCHSDRGTLESKISFSRPFLWFFTGNKVRRRSNWELYSVKYIIKSYPMRRIMITLPRSWKNSRTHSRYDKTLWKTCNWMCFSFQGFAENVTTVICKFSDQDHGEMLPKSWYAWQVKNFQQPL